MSDKNFMQTMGITDEDVVDMINGPKSLIGNADIDFVASYHIYLQNIESEDPDSEQLFSDQMQKLMMLLRPSVFMESSFRFEDEISSYSESEMRRACKAIYNKYK